jgi:hypothetical protein
VRWGKKTASGSSKFDRYCKRGMWVKGAEMWLAPYYEVDLPCKRVFCAG